MVFERFYSYPPVECGWPWVLRNIKQKPQLDCVHEIVDIGIYDLLKPPYRHSVEKLEKWVNLRTDGWKVVPDCPDIRGEFGVEHDMYSNTFYSFELLKEFYDPQDPHHLPVLQSKYQDIKSFKKYIWHFKVYYQDKKVLGEDWVPDKVAIGSICKADDHTLAVKMLKIARREFPEAWVHAFGLRFQQLKRGYKYIDSFDSTSWTFPRTPGRGSCRNKEERIQYFYDYIKRLEMVNVHLHEGQGVLV